MADERRLTIAQIKGAKDLRTVHAVDWPGTGHKVGLLELRCAEIQEAYFAAREQFAKKGWEAIDAAALAPFEEELHVQYCYRALVDPEAQSAEPRFRIFKAADEARARLDPFERDYFSAKLTMAQTAAPAGRLLAELARQKKAAEEELGQAAEEM